MIQWQRTLDGEGRKRMTAPEHIVYVVDDDERIRESIDDLLCSCGMAVAGFGSAADYLKYEKPAIPSCLILDIELPDINGLELQQRLLEAPHPPIIFITGHGHVPQSVQAMKAGAVDFLPKPFAPAQLLAAVDAALALDIQRLAADADLKSVRDRYEELTPANARCCHWSFRACSTSRERPLSASARSRTRFTAATSCARWLRRRSPNSCACLSNSVFRLRAVDLRQDGPPPTCTCKEHRRMQELVSSTTTAMYWIPSKTCLSLQVTPCVDSLLPLRSSTLMRPKPLHA